MDSLQLNLFGDLLDFDTQSKENAYDIKSMGRNGTGTLGKISSEPMPSAAGAGSFGTGASESGEPGKRNDSRPDGKGISQERSSGDSATSIHITSSGEKPSTGRLDSIIVDSVELKVNDRVRVGSGGFGEYTGTIIKVYQRRDEQRVRIVKDDNRGYADEGRLSVISKINLEQSSPSQEAAPPPSPIEQSSVIPRSPGSLRNGHTDDRGNYHITDSDAIGYGGKVVKFEANLSAIELLKELTESKRFATPAEQSILVKYTGWGGLSEVFKKDLDGPWLERQKSLKNALTTEEYSSASRSTLNAHYTDPQIIDGIWTAVTRMGYNGGPTLEPATGVGHFFGKRPQNLPIEMHGIELDAISGRIAQQLYQSANIKIKGYEDIKIPENRYNLIISNVPFGDNKPYEEKRFQTPGLDNRYNIHDFYFLKSLHGLREGGLIAFITSSGTLDKLGTEVREKIAENANFIGAVRLPNNAFTQIANTEVVTDIVFLQKRSSEQEMSEQTKKFIATSTISLEASDGQIVKHAINQYYLDHPEMVLGTHSLTGSKYSKNEYTVSLDQSDLLPKLSAAIEKLPENIMNIVVDSKTKKLDESITQTISHIDVENIPNGSFVVSSDSRLYQKNICSGIIELSKLYADEKQNKNEILRIMLMASIRDSVKDAIDHYHSGQELEIGRDLSRLNSLYDTFVKEHGFLNSRKNLLAFNSDPDSALLQSLEKWDPKTKIAIKTEIFDGIAFVRKEIPTHVESPIDAMALSLSRYGRLNMEYMESLTGNERNALVTNLLAAGHIYQDPYDYVHNSRISYLTADAYLSGNVREKLRIAELASQKEPLFNRNVHSLTQILPKNIEPQDISLRVNSPIVGTNNIRDFVSDLLDVKADKIKVLHVSVTGKWEIDAKITYRTSDIANNETYGTASMSAIDILNNVMNGKAVKVFFKGEDGKQELNQEATSAAEMKADVIQAAFSQWIWKDKSRTDDIAKRYNEVYNSHVERNFIHPERVVDPKTEIWMHGCNFPYPLRPHQADAVWRVLQQNNTMLAHTVGAGKSLEMACSTMELRRLGIRNKPMVVCPDHMIGQWASEFRQAYPAAKLLVADDINWDKENRRTFVNKIATGDWDAIIIRAQSFKMIPMSEEFQKQFFETKIAEYKQILDETDSVHKKSRSVKDLEKAIDKYEDKIKELSDAYRDEGVIPFDKLGVDHLFIDEADVYKNLEYYTQLENVRGLGTAKGSERALDMLMKVRYIQQNDGGVTFATGTPISNTLVEAYTMQRFLQPEALKANGLEAFDEWARQYAEAVTQMELSSTGAGYKPVTRFSKIVNIPELVGSLRQTWDIQTAQNLEQSGILVPGVNLPHMKIINEAAPNTPLLQSYIKHLEERERKLSGKPEKGKDNVLAIMTDGRKAAIDMRFINPHFPDDRNSKLNLAVEVINKVYNNYKAEGYTCAVFFDKSRSFDSSGDLLFDGVADIKRKLIQKGVAPNEIGDVRDCKTFEQRQQLFEKVRDGKVRIILGSTETMGAGTNFQQNLKAIVHIDAPWRPRDIEQQNGRGYRPGNKTGELEVYNLVTKGSLDTGLWNVLETKANSIRQVMDGTDKNTRNLEEDYYGSVKDLSIDNALMKEAVELDHSLRKLRSQERSFNNETSHIHRKIQMLPLEISQAEQHTVKILQDMTSRPPEAKGEHFSIVINGVSYDKRQDAGAKILNEAASLFLEAKNSGHDIEKEVGTYSGFTLILRSTKNDPFSNARLSAIAANFRYSAEIRPDSKAIGICQSLHYQIYSGMDRLHADSVQTVSMLKNSLEEYKSKDNAAFPKTQELKIKEKRYTEVMSELEKQSKEQPKQEDNPHEIPWRNIRSMTPGELRSCVRNFYENIQPVQQKEVKIYDFQSGEGISKAIKDHYSVTLPPSIVSMIDAVLNKDRQLGHTSKAYDLLTNVIDDVRKKSYCWTGSDNEYHASYRKDLRKLDKGDVVIKMSTEEEKNTFHAYRLLDATNSKFLGSDASYTTVKDRVEQYVACIAIREKLNNVLSMHMSNEQKSKNIDI